MAEVPLPVQQDPVRPVPPSEQGPGELRRPVWRRLRWRWALVALAVPAIAAVVAAVLASRYQPIGFGDVGNSLQAFPGLPTGHGIRPVNNMGNIHEDFYIPPQRRVFSLFASIANNGTHAVTITSARLPRFSPLTLAGPVRYSTPGMGGSDEIPPPVSRVLRDVELRPGQEMFLGFPVHMWPCAVSGGWDAINDFDLTVRYAVFSHTVAVPWGTLGDSLIVRSPGGRPGQKGVICAPGTTRSNLPKVPAQNSLPRSLAGTIIRIHHGADVGELRLIEMSAPDAASDLGGALPPCFTQFPPRPTGPPRYRVVNFDLNWADINLGQRGTAPAVRVTIAGPDGTPMVAAEPASGGTSIGCQTVKSFLLGRQQTGWQLVYGMTLRVPLPGALTHLLVTADGHTITVPLVPDCGTGQAVVGCFQGSELGGAWTAGARYSVSLHI